MMAIDYSEGLAIEARQIGNGWRASTTVGKMTFSVDRATEPEARARLIEVFEDQLFGFDRFLARAIRARNGDLS